MGKETNLVNRFEIPVGCKISGLTLTDTSWFCNPKLKFSILISRKQIYVPEKYFIEITGWEKEIFISVYMFLKILYKNNQNKIINREGTLNA